MKKLEKSLTRENYTTLLRIIGSSKQPLSSREVKKKMVEEYDLKETTGPYIHEMIKKMVPLENNIFLYQSDKISENKQNRKYLIKTLNSYFNLAWKERDIDDNSRIVFEKNNDIIKIQDNLSDISITIEKDAEFLGKGVLKIVRGNERYDPFTLLYYKNNVYLDNRPIA